MAKVRVYELAKELGVESKVVMTKLQELGEFVRSASSTVEPPVVKRFNDKYGDELRAAAEERNPGGRLTLPEDVGEALVALASPRLYWMTGNTIGVDGGEMIGSRREGS